MKCSNCEVEMEKKEIFTKGCVGYIKSETGEGIPVEIKKIHVCPKCGKIELFIKE